MANRTMEEATKDKLLLLYMIGRSKELGYSIGGMTKLTKLSFLVELEMIRNKQKGFNFKFFRHYFGPMSKDIYEDVAILCEAGFLTQSFNLSKKGTELLHIFKKEITDTENKEILKQIDRIVRKFGSYPAYRLKNLVYQMKVIPTGYRQEEKIEDLPSFCDVIEKIDSKQAKIEFDLDDDTIDNIYLSIKHANSDDIKIPSVKSIEEIFS